MSPFVPPYNQQTTLWWHLPLITGQSLFWKLWPHLSLHSVPFPFSACKYFMTWIVLLKYIYNKWCHLCVFIHSGCCHVERLWAAYDFLKTLRLTLIRLFVTVITLVGIFSLPHFCDNHGEWISLLVDLIYQKHCELSNEKGHVCQMYFFCLRTERLVSHCEITP